MEILTNHVGYELGAPKRAVLQATETAPPASRGDVPCAVLDRTTGAKVWGGSAVYQGTVEGWNDRLFWSLDFSPLRREGSYVLVADTSTSGPQLRSRPFEVGRRLLLERTAAAVMRYFRSQRCTGRLDRADRNMGFHGERRDRVDVHGGWYDASGDHGKYLSHLSYANYLNPQQTPLVVWSFLAARELLGGTSLSAAPERPGVRRKPTARERHTPVAGRGSWGHRRGLGRALLSEALYGADFLGRMQDPAGYFYTSVFDGWSRNPSQREICSFRSQAGIRSDRYQAGFRQGGGMAIAALARAAAALPETRRGRAYLEAAQRGFAHLEENNLRYLQDGRENVIDDYCALLSSAELYRASARREHLEASRRRAAGLTSRLCADGRYRDWWRAGDNPQRPFYHAAEAGLPVIALLRYAEIEPDAEAARRALETAFRSLRFETSLTDEVANPFGYARQYVRPAHGEKRSAFFMPHDNETGYWWQGENARIASLAVAARLASLAGAAGPVSPAGAAGGSAAGPAGAAGVAQPMVMGGSVEDQAEGYRGGPADGLADPRLEARLDRYATCQLDWILGLNPFDVCMLHGLGGNNPEYEAAHPNAAGGICNGITAGLDDEGDIDFLPEPYAGLGEHRWRWSEQWLPHAAWYLLAVCAQAAAGLRRGGSQITPSGST